VDNLPENPDAESPSCRESDEVRSDFEAGIQLPEGPTCREICIDAEAPDCDYMNCIEGFNMSGPIPMRDGRTIGCCLSTRAFEDLPGLPADCNVTYYVDNGSLCYTPLFYSKVCSESRIRLDARTYLKFQVWTGT